ncbi:unnamed protein product [Phytophthora fragariaefolia]|uniref:Unnamed protein product n=1 Tax=Phytophthora fragariaefolia TaxID=1490495 RepID=A0A9W7D0L8_9STRA|nr:unnamed protein product [Phytophthora fragariaefolia]
MVNAIDDYGAHLGHTSSRRTRTRMKSTRTAIILNPKCFQGYAVRPLSRSVSTVDTSHTQFANSQVIRQLGKTGVHTGFSAPAGPITPGTEDATDPRESPAVTEQEAREDLTSHAVVWDKQRRDLQLAMRSGLDYTNAFSLSPRTSRTPGFLSESSL